MDDRRDRAPLAAEPATSIEKQTAAPEAGAGPNVVRELHELIADGDTVVACWTNTATHADQIMGIPPSGRPLKISGADIHRLCDGRMAEHWHVVEELRMLQQLGVHPAPQAPATS
ncbi:MAG: ester cyclase [Actinobacteria bacterium]|nr:ester cyclase [Actinomycetota bacterium]